MSFVPAVQQKMTVTFIVTPGEPCLNGHSARSVLSGHDVFTITCIIYSSALAIQTEIGFRTGCYVYVNRWWF